MLWFLRVDSGVWNRFKENEWMNAWIMFSSGRRTISWRRSVQFGIRHASNCNSNIDRELSLYYRQTLCSLTGLSNFAEQYQEELKILLRSVVEFFIWIKAKYVQCGDDIFAALYILFVYGMAWHCVFCFGDNNRNVIRLYRNAANFGFALCIHFFAVIVAYLFFKVN